MRREYDYNLSKEENLAIEILRIINLKKHNINNLHFEIVNYPSLKKVFFTCVFNPETNVSLIEHHLNEFCFGTKFIDKSNTDNRRYLTVRIE